MRWRMMFMVVLAWLGVVAPASADVRQEIQFPDLPGYQTLKCDLHMHTVFSDGVVWPTVRIDEAWREGLDAVALTDHVELQPHKQDVSTDRNRPCELAAGRAKEKNILLIKGAEITRDTPPGHFNALFLKDVNRLDTKDFYDVFAQAAGQQAFVFWNHPGWQGPERGRWGEEQTTLFEWKQLHGIEICNGDGYYADAHRWALERNLTLVGNSDIHDPSPYADRTPENHRTMTLVFTQGRSLEAVHEALTLGRTAVWFHNQIIGRQEHLPAMFAACVEIRPPHHRSKDTVWVEIRNRCELDIKLERIGNGQPARISLPARSTSMVQIDLPGQSKPQGLSYRALNFLVGPNEPLQVDLMIPPERASSAPAN